jgi:hypothetical protein
MKTRLTFKRYNIDTFSDNQQGVIILENAYYVMIENNANGGICQLNGIYLLNLGYKLEIFAPDENSLITQNINYQMFYSTSGGINVIIVSIE